MYERSVESKDRGGTKTPMVLWMGRFFAGDGYTNEAWAFVRGLRALGSSKLVLPVPFTDVFNEAYYMGLTREQRMEARQWLEEAAHIQEMPLVTICHFSAPVWNSIRVLPSCPPRYENYENSTLPIVAIGRAIFETNRVPVSWVKKANQMDELWVLSASQRTAFRRSGVTLPRIIVAPAAVDIVRFDPAETPRTSTLPGQPDWAGCATAPRGTCQQRFNFLSVFSWQRRKGWDVLLEAFFREFQPEDNVALLIKTNRPTFVGNGTPDVASDVEALIRERGLSNKTRAPYFIFDDHIPSAAMPRLYRNVDAFVLPSRGEGGSARPVIEAMAMGLPVIATASEVPRPLRQCCTYGIRSELEPVPIGGDFADFADFENEDQHLSLDGHQWHRPSVTHLSQLMRQVVDVPSRARFFGAAARDAVVRMYSETTVAKKLATRAAAVATRAASLAKRAARESLEHGARGYASITSSAWLEGVRNVADSFLRRVEGAELASSIVDLPKRILNVYANGLDYTLYKEWTTPGPMADCARNAHIDKHASAAYVRTMQDRLRRCVSSCESNEVLNIGATFDASTGARQCLAQGFPEQPRGDIGSSSEMGRVIWCLASELAKPVPRHEEATGKLSNTTSSSKATVLDVFAKDGGGTTLLAVHALQNQVKNWSDPLARQPGPLVIGFEGNVEHASVAQTTLAKILEPGGRSILVDARGDLASSELDRDLLDRDAKRVTEAIVNASSGTNAIIIAGSPYHFRAGISTTSALGVAACRGIIETSKAALGLLILDPTSPLVEALVLLRHCRPKYMLVHNTNLEHHAGWIARFLLAGGPQEGTYRYAPLGRPPRAENSGWALLLEGTHDMAGNGANNRNGKVDERTWVLLARTSACPEDSISLFA